MKRTATLTVLAIALAAPLALGGCANQDQRQTTIEPVPQTQETTGAITPTQRGIVRRGIRAAAVEGLAAWKKNDLKAMARYFGPDMMRYYQKQLPAYAAKGQTRVRKFTDIQPPDVVDMNAQGTQALVTWEFYDDSYVADKDGKALTKPTHKDTSLQLTMDLVKGKWIISRIIGATDVLE